ncbi:MAG: hypothetical protein PF487_13215, partial [Bacteroidales bacterium]|nr:hypothetical protein [Bacteroidales bacterium]
TLGATGIPCTNNKNILIANNESDFINCINQLINNKRQQKIIGDEAYELVSQNFNNLNIAKSVLNFYKENL